MINCSLCKKECYPEYTHLSLIATVCTGCAEEVANAFHKKHSGEWLTWKDDKAQSNIKNKRVYISASDRKDIFERDAYRCVSCQSYIDLTLDHIVPVCKGGHNNKDNLQTMCRKCNSSKGIS